MNLPTIYARFESQFRFGRDMQIVVEASLVPPDEMDGNVFFGGGYSICKIEPSDRLATLSKKGAKPGYWSDELSGAESVDMLFDGTPSKATRSRELDQEMDILRQAYFYSPVLRLSDKFSTFADYLESEKVWAKSLLTRDEIDYLEAFFLLPMADRENG